MPMTAQKNRCCYLCRFHNVYWEGTEFAGCECRGWDDPEQLARHHTCARGASAEAARESGRLCPRFVYFPPEEQTG
jgi:hypothetical protein